MAVDTVLSRLTKLRQTGRGTWLACCPAHEDRTPSLTVRELDDGRILIHCFAGCGASDVLAALSLEMTDLFPERLGSFPAVRQPFSPMDVLRALRREAGIIAIQSADIAEGRQLSKESIKRACLAAQRIADAAEYIHAGY